MTQQNLFSKSSPLDMITIIYAGKHIQIYPSIAAKFGLEQNQEIANKSKIKSITFSNSMMELLNNLKK